MPATASGSLREACPDSESPIEAHDKAAMSGLREPGYQQATCNHDENNEFRGYVHAPHSRACYVSGKMSRNSDTTLAPKSTDWQLAGFPTASARCCTRSRQGRLC